MIQERPGLEHDLGSVGKRTVGLIEAKWRSKIPHRQREVTVSIGSLSLRESHVSPRPYQYGVPLSRLCLHWQAGRAPVALLTVFEGVDAVGPYRSVLGLWTAAWKTGGQG